LVPVKREFAHLHRRDPIRFDRHHAAGGIEQHRRVIEPVVEQRHAAARRDQVDAPRAGDEGDDVDVVHADVDQHVGILDARRQRADAARRDVDELAQVGRRR
jgi:hypothetical protein